MCRNESDKSEKRPWHVYNHLQQEQSVSSLLTSWYLLQQELSHSWLTVWRRKCENTNGPVSKICIEIALLICIESIIFGHWPITPDLCLGLTLVFFWVKEHSLSSSAGKGQKHVLWYCLWIHFSSTLTKNST